MKVVVKNSKIKGKGVFAAKNFKKGETILFWHPKATISKKDISSLSKYEQNHITYIGKGKYIVMGIPERFVNHSCEPNTICQGKERHCFERYKKM
jgi:SET domain-containing protein